MYYKIKYQGVAFVECENEEQALHIISQLNPDEKELYILYYWKHKKLKDIAIELNVTHATIRKRHEKLKKKLNFKIKNFENL